MDRLMRVRARISIQCVHVSLALKNACLQGFCEGHIEGHIDFQSVLVSLMRVRKPYGYAF
jgi:hypothetical protein